MTEIERVLVIMAHPDDVDFTSAGTVAGWTEAGVAVSYCIVTDGDAGGFDPEVPRSRIAGIRRGEQRKAGAAVGVQDIEFLGYPDGRLTVTLELRRDLARAIRRVRPDRVLVPSPTRDVRSLYGSHPDHTATGEAAFCAVYPDARNPYAFPELAEAGFEAHTVPETWVLAGPDQVDHHVDITDTFDRKLDALRAHHSQTGHVPGLDERMREWGTRQAEAAGLPPGRLAESFLRLETG